MTIQEVLALLDSLDMREYIIEDLLNEEVETVLIVNCLTEILMIEVSMSQDQASAVAVDTLVSMMKDAAVLV